MSGHSHWAGIKHRKGVVDARRGRLFSKLARHIMAAARRGGDPDMNLTLRYAIDRARAAHMPKDSIDKAIKKGTGELEGESLEDVTYEGVGPEGVQVVVDGLTDNRNRTAAEIRKLFERSGGKMGGPGSVAWNFDLKGRISIDVEGVDEDQLLEIVLEGGGEDVQRDGDVYEIRTSPADFEAVKRALEAKGLTIKSSEIARIPKNLVPIGVEKAARRILDFLGELEDHEDVQTVSANFDIPNEIMDRIGAESGGD
ncbi:MAG: YebC/PmpR family DNA-binding transcriptional regulator [Planctomycetes bacterium]|nr:YebC/PmpR family DNA-binding transcriptional regulator [Planctomycetota bacterium]